MVLGIKPRVSHVLGKCFTIELQLQILDLLGRLVVWGLKSGIHTYKAGALLVESHFQVWS
jgi:hypothetical protein